MSDVQKVTLALIFLIAVTLVPGLSVAAFGIPAGLAIGLAGNLVVQLVVGAFTTKQVKK